MSLSNTRIRNRINSIVKTMNVTLEISEYGRRHAVDAWWSGSVKGFKEMLEILMRDIEYNLKVGGSMKRTEIIEAIKKILEQDIVIDNDNAYNYLSDALDELNEEQC